MASCPISKLKKVIRGGWIAVLSAVVWLLADQISKHWVVHNLFELRNIVDGYLNFVLVFNRGVSFSFLGGVEYEYMPQILGYMAFAVSAYFVYWLYSELSEVNTAVTSNKLSETKKYASVCHTSVQASLFKVGIGSLIGGAIGNGIDRFIYGAVVDFIDCYYGSWHWATFNIADIAITFGVICIMFYYLCKGK